MDKQEILRRKIKLYGCIQVAEQSGLNRVTVWSFLKKRGNTRLSTIYKIENGIKKLEKSVYKNN